MDNNVNSFKDLINVIIKDLPEFIPILFFSALGGFVRVLNTNERPSLRRLFVQIVTAGFVGIMVYLLLSEFNISGKIIAATCGISGFCSKTILDILSKKVIDQVSDIRLLGEKSNSKSDIDLDDDDFDVDDFNED